MRPAPLKKGDLIGIVSPCHVATRERYAPMLEAIRRRGFRVLEGENLYRDTDGYLASVEERAADLNAMARNDEVAMVYFGGGEGGNEVLPYLDFEAIARHPKIYLSYSDGTSILNAVHAATGLVTYYGQAPHILPEISAYDDAQFEKNILRGEGGRFAPNSPWKTLCGGTCEGILAGGFSTNLSLLVDGRFFRPVPNAKYLLFMEDHEQFRGVDALNGFISHVEQSDFMRQVSGMIFGHYSTSVYPDLMARLMRLGRKNGIPVVYTDDFGHGENHAILPIGAHARLDADQGALDILD